MKMTRRRVGVVGGEVGVYYDPEGEEYAVFFLDEKERGGDDPPSTYYTNDKDDAFATAAYMIPERAGLRVRRNPVSWRESEKFVSDAAGALADEAFAIAQKHPWTKLYVIYKPSTETAWGSLRLIDEETDIPPGWELAHNAPLALGERRHIATVIRAMLGRLPLLPFGD